MGVILEKSKEEEVCGGGEREIIEEPILFLQERNKLIQLRPQSSRHAYLNVLFN